MTNKNKFQKFALVLYIIFVIILFVLFSSVLIKTAQSDYSGRSAHALKRVQRTGIAVQQSSAAVQPRPLGMG